MISRLEALKAEHVDEEIRVIADAKPNEFMKLRPNEITHGDIHRIDPGYRGFLDGIAPNDEKVKFIFIFAG